MLVHVTYRPVNDAGERVTPPDLVHLRLTHEFKAPCCLCACQAIGGGYTESAIYIANSEYVAGCASGSCGYLSRSLYTPPYALLRQV
jgi:hypothetical protein